MQKISKNIEYYVCSYCGKEYVDKEDCEYCEEDCKRKENLKIEIGDLPQRIEIIERGRSSIEGIRLLRGVENKEQLEAYLQLNYERTLDCSSYTSEDFTYPCDIMLRVAEEKDCYDDYYSDNLYLSPVKEFLKQHYGDNVINLIKEYCK